MRSQQVWFTKCRMQFLIACGAIAWTALCAVGNEGATSVETAESSATEDW